MNQTPAATPPTTKPILPIVHDLPMMVLSMLIANAPIPTDEEGTPDPQMSAAVAEIESRLGPGSQITLTIRNDKSEFHAVVLTVTE